jgi:alpha-galactosidase/6-phospho-beta-glucosidase family protein
MEKCYTVIISNSENHLYDKLLCNICNGYSNRNNFSRHKNSPRHLAYKKSGIIITNSNGEDRELYSKPEEKTLKPIKTIGDGIYSSTKSQPQSEEEEEEEKPEEVISKFLLPKLKFTQLNNTIKNSHNSNEIDFLQKVFNDNTEISILNLWKYFKDRKTLINEETPTQNTNTESTFTTNNFLGF